MFCSMTSKRLQALAFLVVIFGFDALVSGADAPKARTGMWTQVGMMSAARSQACAAMLADGRILISGGFGMAGALNSAEILGLDGTFSSVPAMSAARGNHSCTTLADGRVLVAGGLNDAGAISLAEVYDPGDNTWHSTADMSSARAGQTATRLQDGRVLIAGGEGPSTVYNTLELFDPRTSTFAFVSTGVLSSPRRSHVAALLSDGRVLVAGGSDGSNALASTDLFDPSTGTVSQGASLSSARTGASATVLVDHAVLIAGGSGASGDLATAEVYDPAAGQFSDAGRMTSARHGHLAFRLPDNNQVILIGGDAVGNTAELFAPWRGAFKPTGGLDQDRANPVGATGTEGLLYVAGGQSRAGRGAVLNGATAYRYATLRAQTEVAESGGAVGTLTGSGWQPGEKVSVLVQENPKGQSERTLSLLADSTGNITTQYDIPLGLQREYTIRATGMVSEAVAHASSQGANLDQCADGPNLTVDQETTVADCATTVGGSWVNGNVGSSKATYFEGDSLPYRMVMTNLKAGTHTLTIQWDTTKSGKHALDYITSFNRTVGQANPCFGVSGCTLASPTIPLAIPPDPNVTGAGVNPVPGFFTMWGATLTGASAYTLSGLYSGDSSTSITITFTTVSGATTAVLAWGGHIATRLDWGATNSAVTISGSPYHTRLVALDGGGGNQDRSLSSDATVFPGSIKIIKSATPQDEATWFPFTASPSPLINFSLLASTDPAKNTVLFPNITNFTTYTVNETPLPIGWTFDSVTCTVSGGTSTTPPASSTSSVSITLKEGDNVVCTYTNHRLAATLVVKKHVVNDNGGTKSAADFTMNVTGTSVSSSSFAGSESGTTVTLGAGNYNVDETAVSGYTKSLSTDCVGKIAYGESKTCTITNDDKPGTLTVIKHVINDNGGTKTAANFLIAVTGVSPSPASFNGSESGTPVTINAGSFSVTETEDTGYTASYSGCSDTIANGESKTCTITNDDKAATLIVIKHVTNDNGGTKTAANFPITVTGGSPSPANFNGAESPGTSVSISPGSFSVAESPDSGYAVAYSADCSGTIVLGDTKTCTITNDDKPGTLTVIKHVTNNNGGTKTAANFPIAVTGGSPSPASFNGSESGTQVTINAGPFSVKETEDTGYTASYSGCSDTIANGESKTCTITNDDKATTLIISKTCAANNESKQFTVKANSTTLTTTLTCGTSQTFTNLNAGSYTITEDTPGGIWNGLLNGWGPPSSPGVFTGPDCLNGAVTLENGTTKVCFVLNVASYCTPTFPPANPEGSTAGSVNPIRSPQTVTPRRPAVNVPRTRNR
jgi:hypothetical protein